MDERDTGVIPETEPDRLSLASDDPDRERVDQLRRLFPEAFTEGSIDFDRLRRALGDAIDDSRERYGLSWAGKTESIRAIQIPSTGTFLPDGERSLDFDAARNVMIEGENLAPIADVAIAAMEPRRVLCLDRAFHGNDALKTNAVLQMRDRGIEFRTV